MTYEERLKYFCEQSCHDRQQCGYVNRGMISDCTYLQDIMVGWEAGYQDAVEKALHLVSAKTTDRFIKEFKKYMEE